MTQIISSAETNRFSISFLLNNDSAYGSDVEYPPKQSDTSSDDDDNSLEVAVETSLAQILSNRSNGQLQETSFAKGYCDFDLPKRHRRFRNPCSYHKKRHQKCPMDCPTRGDQKDEEPVHKKKHIQECRTSQKFSVNRRHHRDC